jgi:hypothetical protein
MFILYGTGANGKSTFLNVIQTIPGDYALSAWAETFMKRNQQPRPEGRGMLFSKGGCTQGFNTFLIAMNLPREPVSGLLGIKPHRHE